MRISEIQTSDDFIQYIRTFKSWGDEKHIYDFNFVVHMMLATIDNLQTYALHAELEEIGYSFSAKQRQFIAQLVNYINLTRDEDIEKE